MKTIEGLESGIAGTDEGPAFDIAPRGGIIEEHNLFDIAFVCGCLRGNLPGRREAGQGQEAQHVVPITGLDRGGFAQGLDLRIDMPHMIAGDLSMDADAVIDIAAGVKGPVPVVLGEFLVGRTGRVIDPPAGGWRHRDGQLVVEGAQDCVGEAGLVIFQFEGKHVQEPESGDVDAEHDWHALGKLVVIPTFRGTSTLKVSPVPGVPQKTARFSSGRLIILSILN